MANPNPKVENLRPTRWVKGQSGNPSGKRKLPADLRKVADYTLDEIKRIFAKYGRMTAAELRKAIADPNLDAMHLMIAATYAHAIKTGDYSRAAFLIDRLVGKASPSDPNASDVTIRIGYDPAKPISKQAGAAAPRTTTKE
jgi:hypothetical protein